MKVQLPMRLLEWSGHELTGRKCKDPELYACDIAKAIHMESSGQTRTVGEGTTETERKKEGKRVFKEDLFLTAAASN